jgi:hypothetical protein
MSFGMHLRGMREAAGLSRDELARLLRVRPDALAWAREAGDLKAVARGGVVLELGRDVVDWLLQMRGTRGASRVNGKLPAG